MPITKKISAGFATDMNALQVKFTSADTLYFKDFSRIWREMQFSLIFCGRKDVRENWLFVEEIIPIILKNWHPASTYQDKVFALYMLYAVYATQPLYPKIKIRLRLSEWNQSEELLLRATKDNQLNVCYAIQRMRLEKCFHLVASLKRRSPIMLAFESEEDAYERVELRSRVFSDMEKACAEGGTFENLSLRHQLYMALKTGQGNPHVKALDMVKDNIFEDLIKEFKSLQANYKAEQETAADTSQDEIEDSSTSEDEDNLALRRSALRAKLYSAKTATHKERRFEQLLEEPSCSGWVEAFAPPAAKEADRNHKGRASASATRKCQKMKNSPSLEASAEKPALPNSGRRTSASGTGKSRKEQGPGSPDASVAPATKRATCKSKPETSASGTGKSRKEQGPSSPDASVAPATKRATCKSKPETSASGTGKSRKKQGPGSPDASVAPAAKRASRKSEPETSAPGTGKSRKKQGPGSPDASVAPAAKRATCKSKPETSASGTGKSRKKQGPGSPDASVAPAAKRASRKSKPETSASGAGTTVENQDK